MNFFNLIRKKETKEETIVNRLTINELKNKIINEIKSKDEIKNIENEVNSIKRNITELRKANNELLKKEAEGDYSKALIIGVNNAKKALCNTINLGTNERKVESLTSFYEYLNENNNLINNSHNALRKYSNAVNVIYKKEMLGLIEQLELLNEKLNKNANKTKIEFEMIKELNFIIQLIKEKESLDENKKNLEKELKNNYEVINEKNPKEFINKLKIILDSEELAKAKENELKVKNLTEELNMINYRANTIISYLSKILKNFKHDSSSNFIDSLNNEPLKTINNQKNEFEKLKEVIIKELNNKNIELNDKQELKAKQAIESDELTNLSKKYESINDSIKKIDLRIIDQKKELEETIDKLTKEKQELSNKSDLIKDKIKTTESMITDLINRIQDKASETLKIRIELYK